MTGIISVAEASDRVWDLIVIGSGIAGLSAAIRAAQHGLEVLVVDHSSLGGVSLNRGCIAARFIEKAVEVYEEAGIASLFGVFESEFLRMSIRGLQERKQMVLNQVVRWYLDTVLPSYGISILRGRARLVQPHGVKVAGTTIDARYIVIATGATTSVPRIPGIEEALRKRYAIVLEDSLSLVEVPESIIVYGGSLTAVEVASIWARLGAHTVIVNPEKRIIPEIGDREIASLLASELKMRGVRIYNNRSIARIDVDLERVRLSSGEWLTSSLLIIALKRRPNVEDLGLEDLGVEYDDNGVITDDRMRTTSPRIYAAGDVVGRYMYANAARLEGVVAANNIAGLESRISYEYLPIVGFTEPEISSVGVTSDARNPDYIVGKLPLSVNFYAYSSWKPYGLAKIVAERDTHIIRGFHMIGLHAAEAANVAAIAIKKKMRLEEATELAPAHPTISEVFVEAAYAALGSSIYLPKRVRV